MPVWELADYFMSAIGETRWKRHALEYFNSNEKENYMKK